MGKVTNKRRQGLLNMVKEAIAEGDLATLENAVTAHRNCVNLKTREFGKEYSLLGYACLKNQVEAADFLIRAGASVMGKDAVAFTDYPLYIAAELGHLEIIKLLINCNGGVPSIVNELLLNACRSRLPLDFVDFLLSSGADANVSSRYGFSPLQLSLCGSHSCTLTELLLRKSKNISVNHTDDNGCSALMYAARIKCISCMDLLLEKGAFVDQVNSFGEFAVHFFLENIPRKVPSESETRMFRKLLQCTSRSLLRDTALSLEYKSRLLSCVLNSKAYIYMDIIHQEGFQLADFLPDDIIAAELLEDFSIHYQMTPERYRDICFEALVERGALLHPLIYVNLLHPKLHYGLLLGFIQHGLPVPRALGHNPCLDNLTFNDSSMQNPAMEYYEDSHIYACNSLRILFILRILRVVDDSRLISRIAKILHRKRKAGTILTKQVKSIEAIIGKCDSLQSVCRAEIREHLFKIHGQKNLNLIINKLALPEVLSDYLLLRTKEMNLLIQS